MLEKQTEEEKQKKTKEDEVDRIRQKKIEEVL